MPSFKSALQIGAVFSLLAISSQAAVTAVAIPQSINLNLQHSNPQKPPPVEANTANTIVDASEQPAVRVRLSNQLHEIIFYGSGFKIQGQQKAFQKIAIARAESVRVHRIVQNHQYFWLVHFEKAGVSKLYSDSYLAIEATDLRYHSQQIPQKIFLAAAKKSAFDLVAVVPLEEYVRGVVAGEMPKNWPLETLKAQAVAARSYTLATMAEKAHSVYHVESSVLDQVFRYTSAQDESSQKKIDEAVRLTRGEVLKTSRGQIVKAYYHSDCGGKTVSAKSVWSSGVNSGETVDNSCPYNPNSHWQTSLLKENVFQSLAKFLKIQPQQIVDIDFVYDQQHERVQKVVLQLKDSSTRLVAANDFRAQMGYQIVRSTLFEVQKEGDKIEIKGKGFGHGVGLCQWGSRYLGQQGLSYQKILKHYYPLLTLNTLKN